MQTNEIPNKNSSWPRAFNSCRTQKLSLHDDEAIVAPTHSCDQLRLTERPIPNNRSLFTYLLVKFHLPCDTVACDIRSLKHCWLSIMKTLRINIDVIQLIKGDSDKQRWRYSKVTHMLRKCLTTTSVSANHVLWNQDCRQEVAQPDSWGSDSKEWIQINFLGVKFKIQKF